MQKLEYDGQINIAVGLSAESKIWKNTKIKWSEFVEKIAEERKTSETLKQFLAASKAEQGKIKDVGEPDTIVTEYEHFMKVDKDDEDL